MKRLYPLLLVAGLVWAIAGPAAAQTTFPQLGVGLSAGDVASRMNVGLGMADVSIDDLGARTGPSGTFGVLGGACIGFNATR